LTRLWNAASEKKLPKKYAPNRSKENENAGDAASDPAIKASVDAFSMDAMSAAINAVEAERAGGWQKPPEPPGEKNTPARAYPNFHFPGAVKFYVHHVPDIEVLLRIIRAGRACPKDGSQCQDRASRPGTWPSIQGSGLRV